MADTGDIKVSVDASQGKAELKKFTQAVGTATSKLEELRAAAASAGTGGFASLGSQIKNLSSGFNSLKGLTGGVSAAREIRSLSNAAMAFKAPSSSQISNLHAFAKAVKQFENLKVSKFIGGDIASLSRGLAQVTVPNSATIARLPALLKELQKVGNIKIGSATASEIATVGKAFQHLTMIPANSAQRINQVSHALNGIKIDPQAASALIPFTTALSAIKAPSKATIGNLASLIRSLSTGNVGQINAMTTALQRLNGLNIRAGAVGSMMRQPAQVPRVRLAAAPTGPTHWFSSLSGGASRATGEMRGLENQFNMTYQAASMFRTLLGSMTLGEFSKAILDAGNKVLGFKLSMDAIATSPHEAGDQMQFLIDMSNRTGTALAHNIDAFTRFAAAARTTGASVAQTQKIYEAFSTAFAVMHVSAQRQNLAFLAVQEAFSKDQVQKQQAVRQLATELPGAVSIMAQAMNMTTRQLEEHFKKGDLDPQQVFSNMADVLQKRFGSQLPEALKHSQASLNRLGNAFMELKSSIFDNGFDAGLSAMIQGFTNSLSSAGIEDIGKRIGAAFKEIFVAAGALGRTLIDYAEPIGKFALALSGLMIARGAAGALTMMKSPVVMIGGAALLTYEAVNNLGGGFSALAGPASIAVALLMGVGSTGALIAAGFGVAIEAARLLGTAISHIIPQGWRDSIQANVNWLADQIDSLTGSHALHNFRVSQGFDLPESVTTAAGIEKFSASGKDAGKGFGDGVKDGIAASYDQLKSDIAGMSTMLSKISKEGFGGLPSSITKAFNFGPLKDFQEHLNALQKDSDKLGGSFHGLGDYAGNIAAASERAARKLSDLTDEQQKLFNSTLKSHQALKTLREQLALIDGMKGKKVDGEAITGAQIAAFKRTAIQKALPDINPVAAQIQQYNGQLEQYIAASKRAAASNISFKDALEQEKAVLQAKNKLLKEGKTLAESDANAIRKMVSAMQEVKRGGDNGVSQWVHGLKDIKTATDDAIKNGIDKLSDSLADFVVTGKANFRDLSRSIAREFIKIGIQNLMKQAFQGAGFGGGIADAVKALSGGKSYVDTAIKGITGSVTSGANVGVQNVTAGVVNINGAGIGALGAGGTGTGVSGLKAFGTPNTTSITGVNPEAVGGIKAIAPQTVDFSKAGVDTLAKTSTGFSSAFPLSIAAGGAGAAGAFTKSSDAASAAGQWGPWLGSQPLPSKFTPFPAVNAAPSASNANAFDSLPSSAELLPRPTFASQPPASILDQTSALKQLTQAGIAPTNLPGLAPAAPSFANGAPSLRDIGQYIWSQAPKHGVNPGLALGIANGEGLNKHTIGSKTFSNADAGGTSYGPFQLFSRSKNPHVVAPGGMAAQFQKKYGEIPSAANWRDQVDFSLSRMHHSGVHDWYSVRDADPLHQKNWARGQTAITHRGEALARQWGLHKNQNGVDMTPTGSIGNTAGANQLNQAMKQSAEHFKQAMQPATTQIGHTLTTNLKTATQQIGPQLTTALSPATGSLSQVTKSVAQMGQTSVGAVPGLDQIIQQIAKLGGGGGGLLGGLLGGLFSEGGYSEHAVAHTTLSASAWHGAPHYAEGTANTSGGMPAILHPNEAVIPLTRGRKIPIEMKDGGGSKDSGRQTNNHMTVNIQSKDHDSFRRNSSQLASEMQKMMGRIAARNS